MTYNLGIDIGIASVGLAGVDTGSQSILFCGAHIFEAAENPKDGASLAQPRREKRGQRRVIRRRSERKKAIRQLLARHALVDLHIIDQKQVKGQADVTPWRLRKQALERRLTDGEFARVLFHISKRRGFQSNRKGAEPNDLEGKGKKALSGAKDLEEAMFRANAGTVGAYLATLTKQRNGDGSYENFVTRDLLRQEVRKIFATQQKLGNAKATQELQEEFFDTAFYQRPLQSSEHLVGFCELEPFEKRAPKAAYSAELFVLWSRLNTVKIRQQYGEERFLTLDEKQRLCDLAHKKHKDGVTYKQARKALDLQDDQRFNISYHKVKAEDNDWSKIRDAAEKTKFLQIPAYHKLKEALDSGSAIDWQKWTGADRSKLNEIARILSFYEDKDKILNMLSDLELTETQTQNLLKITSFSKTLNLSIKAIEAILPFMQQGFTYDKACAAAGYHHSKKEKKSLNKVPVFDDIRNPVVNRALGQTRKVMNAVIQKYGMPERIIVEVGRDVGRRFEDRRKIEKEQKKNQADRERARSRVAELFGISPDDVRGGDILKHRLWEEQNCLCPYSNKPITPDMLKDSTATQIDHIIPYQRSWNDSYMNKVLCLTSENQNKRNELPLEYFSRIGRDTRGLETIARRLPSKKAENLLLENFDDEKASAWKDRALNDTRYMSRLLKNHLENLNLEKGVETRNGQLTAHLRNLWGFAQKNRDNDRHHALDAIVIACSTQSMVQKVANWHRNKNQSQELKVAVPWEGFRDDALAAVDKVFVSRMPVRKVTGAAHEDTIRSIRFAEDGARQIVQRIKLQSLNLNKLESLVDKERNIALYTVLKERLEAHDDKADKAFAEPVYMPVKDPSKTAPRINSVRIVTNEKSGIEINNGFASNGDMVRVDVFQKNGKYFLVPIYVHHFAGKELPNRAVLQGKPEDEWEEMDDKDFLFSLYRNDYVRLKSKKETIEGYYVGIDRATGAMSIRSHDNDPSFGKDGVLRTGVKSLLGFEKYAVDYFGTITPKQSPGIREKRIGLAHGHDPESSKVVTVKKAADT
jgi:CRISPR-associated endonuclease Csn1